MDPILTDGFSTFPEFLQRQIDSRSMTPRQFALFVGVDPSTVTRILNGDLRPGADFLVKLARATHISIGTLMEYVYPELRTEPEHLSSKVLAQQIEQLPDPVREAVMMIIKGALTTASQADVGDK